MQGYGCLVSKVFGFSVIGQLRLVAGQHLPTSCCSQRHRPAVPKHQRMASADPQWRASRFSSVYFPISLKTCSSRPTRASSLHLPHRQRFHEIPNCSNLRDCELKFVLPKYLNTLQRPFIYRAFLSFKPVVAAPSAFLLDPVTFHNRDFATTTTPRTTHLP